MPQKNNSESDSDNLREGDPRSENEKAEDFSQDFPKKNKVAGRKFFYFFFVLLIIFVFTWVGLDIWGRVSATDFSGQKLVAPKIDKIYLQRKVNGYYSLNEAVQKIKIPEGGSVEDKLTRALRGKRIEPEIIEDLFDSNSESLALFDKAIGKEVIQFPGWGDIKARDPEKPAPMPNLKKWGSLAHLQGLRAVYSAQVGELRDSINYALDLMKFGSKICNPPRLFPRQLKFGLGVEDKSIRLIYYLLSNYDLDPQTLDRIEREFQNHQNDLPGVKNALKLQYTYSRKTISALGHNSEVPLVPFLPTEQVSFLTHILIKNHYFYSPADTDRLQAKYIFEPTLSSIEKGKCINLDKEQKQQDKNLRKLKRDLSLDSWLWHFSKNSMGKLYVADAGLLEPFQWVKEACKVSAKVDLLRAAAALKAFEVDNGQLPSTLSDLTPSYLSQVPRDPFADAKIRYLPDRRLVYSVGGDSVDNKGRNNRDFVFLIPEPTAEEH